MGLLLVYYIFEMYESRYTFITDYVIAYTFIYECNAWYLKWYIHNIAFFLFQLIIPVSQFTASIFFSFLRGAHAKNIKDWKNSNMGKMWGRGRSSV